MLDIDETTNAGDEPVLIEMRFHVKMLPTFASRSLVALKGLFGAAALAGALALSLAAPMAALADEEEVADSGMAVETAGRDGATADSATVDEAAVDGTTADEPTADEDATQTVTIYHFELVNYDDPTLEDWGVPELVGTRLLGTTTVEGLKPGDVVKAWDHVGTNPGFAFFDGWPREVIVSEDSSKNAIRLNYFRRSSNVTVNYYEASLLDATASMPLYNHTVVETIGDHAVAFTKMGSEVRKGELFADVLTGDKLAEATEPVDGLAYVGSYPDDVFVSMDPSKNEINLVYTRPVARPDEIEVGTESTDTPDDPNAGETPDGSETPGTPDATPDAPSNGGAGNGSNAPGTSGGSSGDSSDASKPNTGATSNGGSQGTQVIDEAAAGNANHAEAEAASKDGVLTLPQTGDEKGLVFAVILLVSGVAAVGAAMAFRKIRR